MKRKCIFRLIALLLTACLLSNLCACVATDKTSPQQTTEYRSEIEETLPTEHSDPTAPETLTCDDVMEYIETRAIIEDWHFSAITDVETEVTDKPGQVVTRFNFFEDYVAVTVRETNGYVDSITTIAFPEKFYELNTSSSATDAIAGAYAFSMIPIYACGPHLDINWHAEQMSSATNEGDDSTLIYSYNSDEWLYMITLDISFVACLAYRYCSECENNATKVTFSPGISICDACSNPEAEETLPEETAPPAAPLQPKNDVPYTLPLSAEVTVYDGPGYEYTDIRSIGEDGVYTIVEEQFDSGGNLWGRLKSGIGWVCITDHQQAETNTDGSVLCPSNPLMFSSEFDGRVYDISFVFEENGTVYIAYGESYAGAIGGGHGTYTVANGVVTLSIKTFGRWEEYSFEFSKTDTLTFVQKSDKGIFNNHQPGDVFQLTESTYMTNAKVKEIATYFEEPVEVSW